MALPPPPAADPMGGAAPPDPADESDTVVCTICKNGDGSYTVYAGDEPEPDDTGDEMGGMGAGMPPGGAVGPPGAGAEPDEGPPAGVQASGVGEALRAAMDVLQADASAGGNGPSDQDQFAAGFASSRSPTPQKL